MCKEQSFAAILNAANKTNQMIVVVGNGGTNATISFHQKKENGWVQAFSTAGYVGCNGITKDKVEGDGKTPVGVFRLGLAFGIEPDPGSQLTYRQVKDSHYWVDDAESQYYNQWVDKDETGLQWKSAEHLIEETIAYKYGIEICCNPSNKPGKGSAVFLHCIHGTATAGCVSVEEDIMKKILTSVNEDTLIVIAKDEEGLKDL